MIFTIFKNNAKISREKLTQLMAKEIFLSPQEAKNIFKNIYIEDEQEEILNSTKEEEK